MVETELSINVNIKNTFKYDYCTIFFNMSKIWVIVSSFNPSFLWHKLETLVRNGLNSKKTDYKVTECQNFTVYG